jgi:zinc protease
LKRKSPEPEVVKVRLENGVTLVIKEKRRAPLLSVQVCVRAGTIYEGEWLGSGISHFLEHVIDDGTTKRSREEIDDLVETLGNVSNAYTARDHTRYVVTATSAHTDAALELLADYIQDPLMPEADVVVQRGVILNELNQVADNPDDLLGRAFYETVYRVHPLRVPIEGYRQRFESLTRNDLAAYHKRLYLPQNIVVAVVGDIEAERVERRLTDLWGRMSPDAWAPPVLPNEPLQVAPRETWREGAVELGYGIVGYRTFAFGHPDAPALFLLGVLIGGSESSRLHRELKGEREIVHGAQAWTEIHPVGDCLLGISFSCEPELVRAVRDGILGVVESVKNGEVRTEELETAKAIAEAESLLDEETVEDEASVLSYHELSMGDATYPRRFLERVRSVTGDDVKRVAWTWLRDENLTLAVMTPKRDVKLRALRSVPTSESPVVSRHTLANGLRLVVEEDDSQPIVFVGAFFAGGVYRESELTNGVSRLTARAMLRGTTTRGVAELARVVEARGGILEAISGNQSLGVALTTLARDLEPGVEVLSDVLRNPTFPHNDIEALKRETLAHIRAQSEDAFDSAYRALLSAFYAHHPYRHVPEGSTESVRSLTVDDCRSFHRRFVVPNNGVVSVVGDVAFDEIRALIDRLFADWEPRPVEPTYTLRPRRAREIRVTEERNLAQAIICVGYPGVSFTHPDADALLMLQATIAGLNYPGGRLYKELRQRQLVYEVSAEHQAGIDTGMLHIYTATTDEHVSDVIAFLDETVTDLQTTPISDAEHRRVMQMCLADFFVHLQTHEERAYRRGLDDLYGLGYDFIERFESRMRRITPDEIRHVARRYLNRQTRVVSVVRKSMSRRSSRV